MIQFNFFSNNKRAFLHEFCQYFNLEKDIVSEYLVTNNDTVTPNSFANEFNLNLNNYNSNKIELICRHITTIADEDFEEFTANGIWDLLSVLQKPTPLSRFLLSNGIQINIKEKVLVFNEIRIPIDDYEKLNLKAFKAVKNFTLFERNIRFLCIELFRYKGVVNFFINDSIDEIAKYSCLKRQPEILLLLDNIMESIPIVRSNSLGRMWQNRNVKPYIIEFKIALSQIAVPVYTWHDLREEQCQQCFILSGYDYEHLEQKSVPKNLFNNVRLLRWFLYVFLNNAQYDAWLLPAKKIAPIQIINIINISKESNY